jgi:hypothetical protein
VALPAVGDAPLPSAVPPCRRCGKPMEPGWVEGDGAPVGSAGTISWSPAGSGELEDLAPLPFWSWGASHRFPAIRCAACGIVEIDYKQPCSR